MAAFQTIVQRQIIPVCVWLFRHGSQVVFEYWPVCLPLGPLRASLDHLLKVIQMKPVVEDLVQWVLCVHPTVAGAAYVLIPHTMVCTLNAATALHLT